ncbi:MAG: hypothetical protein K0Q59_2065 [Paenibacillus sp.]|nr:hypothetical protein [Paenibacillus sp.]
MKNVLVTGYRAHELQIFDEKHKGIPYIKKAIAASLLPLIEEGLEWVITPGQYGVDLWACEVAFELKKTYPQLKCSILSAYANPEQNWKENKVEYYQTILRQLDHFATVSNQPYDGPWQLKARDDLLFRKTDGIVLVYDEEAAEGGARFYKQRALAKQSSGEYRYISILLEDIQRFADEEAYRSE